MAPAISIATARAAVRGMGVVTVHARAAVKAVVADAIDNDKRDTDGIIST